MQLARRLQTRLPDQSRPDVPRITEVLDGHGVDHLVIGAPPCYPAPTFIRPAAYLNNRPRKPPVTRVVGRYTLRRSTRLPQAAGGICSAIDPVSR